MEKNDLPSLSRSLNIADRIFVFRGDAGYGRSGLGGALSS
jgi:hypothetical protein